MIDRSTNVRRALRQRQRGFIINPFRFGGGEPEPPADENVWDSTNKSEWAVLAADDTELRNILGPSDNYANARSVRPLAGKCYFSARVRTPYGGATVGLGVADGAWSPASSANWIGNAASNVAVAAWFMNGNVYTNGSIIGNLGSSSDAQIQIAVDVSTRKVWVRRDGGAWLGGGDPAAGTSPTLTLPGSGDIYVAATLSANSSPNTNFYAKLARNASEVTGTVPSGFTAANWG